MNGEIKTTQEAGERLHKAFINLQNEVFESFRIESLVDRLNKFLKRIIWKNEEK